jgi:hypothetical protein
MPAAYRELYQFIFGNDQIPDSEAHNRLKIAILTLPPRERKIIDLIYGLSDGYPKALKEVARMTPNFNKPDTTISSARINQIQHKAARRLRHPRHQIKYSDYTMATKKVGKPLMERSVYELDFTIRTHNCLRNAGIKTIAELVAKSGRELLKSRNFGRKSLQWLHEGLAEYGLHLRDESIFEEETIMGKTTMLMICRTANGYALAESLNPENLKDPRLLKVFETKDSLLNWIRENLSEESESTGITNG